MNNIDLSNFVWDDSDTAVSEVFALPIGLRPAVKLDGLVLYSSPRLKASFIKALGKSGRTKGSIQKFMNLIDREKIIPCFTTKGLPGFIAWRIFAPVNVKSIMGFYAPAHDKIFVLISNNANIFGHVSNNFMAELTVHECVHMIANKLKSGFFNLYSKDLTEYYTTLWSKIFIINKKELSPSKVKPIILFLSKLESSSKKISNSDLLTYHKILKKSLKSVSNLDDVTFERMLNDYIVILKIFLSNTQVFFQVRRKFYHILSPMYLTYKESFNMTNLTTVCIQELLYPSEIIAILSENMRHTAKALKGIMKL